MAKKIQIMVAAHPEMADKALVKVVSQTHRGYSFGPYYQFDSRKFTASNGLTIASNVRPAKDASDKNTIWLRGSDSTKDGNTIVLTTDKAEMLKAAVLEYNAKFDAPVPAPAAPVCPSYGSCVTVVG